MDPRSLPVSGPAYAGMNEPPPDMQLWMIWRDMAAMRFRIEALEKELEHLKNGTQP